MHKVLVTGPDGFVGTAVCNKLVTNKTNVRGAQWQKAPLPPQCESVVVGDICADTDWSDALRNIDTVVHLAARVHIMNDTAGNPLAEFRKTNVDGTEALAKAAATAGVKRFVFISTIKVCGEQTNPGCPFTEHNLAPEDPYAISKKEAEDKLKNIAESSGMEFVILRPPLLYGPGVKANFLKLIQLVDKRIPLPLGGIKNKRSLLGLSNFANLISTCVTHPNAANQTFVVSDNDDVSTPELIKRIASALGKRPHLLPIPEWMMKAAGAAVGKSAQVHRLCSSLQIDSSYVRKKLDWQPPHTMTEELEKVAAWFKEAEKFRSAGR